MKTFRITPFLAVLFTFTLVSVLGTACKEPRGSDEKQRAQQEAILAEGTSAVGMPATHNFFERRMLKQIFELRDQADYLTYTYTYNEMTGDKVFLCDSIGYGIPSATQYTNPQKWDSIHQNPFVIAQADPNGLFSPSSAEATWVLCKDPRDNKIKPIYVEPRIITSPFPLGAGTAEPVDAPRRPGR